MMVILRMPPPLSGCLGFRQSIAPIVDDIPTNIPTVSSLCLEATDLTVQFSTEEVAVAEEPTTWGNLGDLRQANQRLVQRERVDDCSSWFLREVASLPVV